jgi:hypothetical protein
LEEEPGVSLHAPLPQQHVVEVLGRIEAVAGEIAFHFSTAGEAGLRDEKSIQIVEVCLMT